jgi:acetyl-CoA acetyltransferase
MAAHDIVIAAHAETPIVHRSGRSAYDLAGDVLDAICERWNIVPADIDGFAATAALSEGSSPFHAAYLADTLGLELDWLGSGNVGGCSMLCAVSAAALALRDGRCRVALVVGADAPNTRYVNEAHAYRDEFQAPTGVMRPPQAFGLIQNAYASRYGNPDRALGKVVVTQRAHALHNARACTKLQSPLSLDDYLQSRPIADPLRLLDSVMFCDGANGVLMMREDTAAARGLRKMVRLAGYAERTHHAAREGTADLLDSGFSVAGPRALAQAGLGVADIDQLQLYDDFSIALLLQLEQIGFCGRGEGAAFVEATDFGHAGTLPLNTGGGQLSAGQPGLASGGLNLVEAVRQLTGEGGATQAARCRNALVTGIGGISYSRGWMMSSALVLQA